MKLEEIAERINAYLVRFEKDPKLNKRDPSRANTTPFYNAHAFRAGRYVRIMYVSYQGIGSITKQEAEQYLAWLGAGNVGKHYAAARAATPPKAGVEVERG